MAEHIFQLLSTIPWPWVAAVVFALAAAETAIFLGFLVPGELVVIVGGALAGRGDAPLAAIVVGGVLGAIAGDLTGYAVGRRYGAEILNERFGPRWTRAQHWLKRRGAKAVFLGRFAPFVRSAMPAAAGAAKVPLERFVPSDVAAGLVWGAGSALLGYFLGRNFETLVTVVERTSWILGVAAAIALVFFARRFARRRASRS